jgi:hypothetical protein
VVTALPRRVLMNTLGFQDEIDMKLVAPAATDEALVAAAKLGNHPAFAELWTRHSTMRGGIRVTNDFGTSTPSQTRWTS